MKILTIKRIIQLTALLWFFAGLANCAKVASQVGVSSGGEVMFLLWGIILGPVILLVAFAIPASETEEKEDEE